MSRTKIYTVHTHDGVADAADKTQWVYEGFALGGFVFHIFWLLYQRLWLFAAGYVALVVALSEAAPLLGISSLGTALLQFLLQLMLGFSGNDLIRWRLKYGGYQLTAVIAAESELHAQRRFYDATA